MDAKDRAERALRHAPIMPTAKQAVIVLIEIEIIEAEREAVRQFVKRVNAKAEENMAKTGKREGSYYAAIQTELERLAI